MFSDVFSGHPAPTESFGVYIHVPFCARRCDYCAFATWTDRGHLTERYLEVVRAEIVGAAMVPATSVFVGGGTPTLVPAAALAEVISEVPLAPGAEVTVECNPDDVTGEMMRIFRDCGVTRISIGVQSMVGHVLDSLGRTHVAANVERAVEAVVGAGVATFNLDLIYGAAGETVDDWRTTVDAAVRLGPPHISAYALTVEAGTPLAGQTHRHPDDDDLADKYELADELLGAAGMENYEVSNWARPGHECRHNVLYWRQGNYRGFGCAAHSHHDGRRWWNVRTPERYIVLASGGESTTAGEELLDDDTRRMEGLQLALRMRDGVPLDALDPSDVEGDLKGLVEVRDHRVRLTRHGRLLANEVSMRLRE